MDMNIYEFIRGKFGRLKVIIQTFFKDLVKYDILILNYQCLIIFSLAASVGLKSGAVYCSTFVHLT